MPVSMVTMVADLCVVLGYCRTGSMTTTPSEEGKPEV